MIFPATTALVASLLALMFVGLSFWVVLTRVSRNTLFGTGDAVLQKRTSIQSNFAEYVPYALVLIALLEALGAAHGFVLGLLVVLVVARLLHPFGIYAAPGTPQMFACRGGGTAGTLLVIAVAAVALILRLA